MEKNIFMQMHSGNHLKELKLKSETQEQIKKIIAAGKMQPTVKDKAALVEKIKPGMRVLFHGASETGKSQAAAAIGKEMAKPVYHIHLSAIVSKYIGETEKNIKLLFEKAADEKAILFFDEADALFGKRSTIKDSHDKFASQEISYLLQRIDEHEGLVILSSGSKANMDPAIKRKFNAIVRF